MIEKQGISGSKFWSFCDNIMTEYPYKTTHQNLLKRDFKVLLYIAPITFDGNSTCPC